MRRLRERVSPGGDLVRKVHDDVLHGCPPSSWRPRARRPGCVPPGAPHDPLQRRTRPARSPCCWRRRDCPARRTPRAAAARPLPRADEHLRRPRQHHLPAAPLRVARDRLLLRGLRSRRGLRPGRTRPALHRRRPGPRPGARRRGHAAHEARRDRLRRRGRRRAARRLRRLPAARPQLPARHRLAARPGHRRPRDGARGGAEADRQRLDRGRRSDDAPRGAGRVREPRRAHPSRRRTRSRSAASCTATATTAPTASRASGA